MNYLDLFKVEGELIPERYISRFKNFKGLDTGKWVIKPFEGRILADILYLFNLYKESQKVNDKLKEISLNSNKNSSFVYPNWLSTFNNRIGKGNIMDDYPADKWSLSNFTTTPVEGS